MTDTFYRATLHLERVEPYTNKYDNLSERTTEISAHTVTGATPADAMYQIHDHAETLYDWHQQAEDDNPPVLDEAVRLGSPLLDLTKVFKQGAFVACKAPADWAPGHFCRGPIGHDGPCDFVPADQLRASNADEGGDKCGAISPFGGNACIKPAGHLEAGDPIHDDGEPPFAEVLQQPDETPRALPGDLIAPPAGTPIVITSPPGPNPAVLEQLADDVRRDIKRRRYDSGF